MKAWLDRLIKALLSVACRRSDAMMWRRRFWFSWACGRTERVPVGARLASSSGHRYVRQIPSIDGVQGFRSILPQNVAFEELWQRLQGVRTYPEQVRAYLRAVKNGKPGH